MYFIGVTTAGSSITRLFPEWARLLGLADAQLVGVDLEPHASPQHYRDAVLQIRDDPLSLGALVTTHKIDLLAAARDLFDELDRYAELCAEVSNIAKRDGRVIGFAKDPLTAARTLDEMIGPHHFGKTDAAVLCLGSGGSTAALAAHLLGRDDRPMRLIAVSRSQPGLDNLRRVVAALDADVPVEYVLNDDARRNDEIVASLPPGSLVVNATGMGKDRPGSPVTDAAVFPDGGVAWELNYRGELGFLHQARRQQASRRLRVHDGWRYFLHGWVEHIAEVFGRRVDPALFDRLASAAEGYRP
jgi:shikimate dehydrogenase